MNSEDALRQMDTGGTFLGHFLAGSIYISFGMFFLCLSLSRARSLRPGESFVKLYVPERNKQLLTRLAALFISLLCVGIVAEGSGYCIDTRLESYSCFFHQSFHQTVYLMHAMIGLVAFFEAKGRLPPDSWRAMFALTNFCAGLMFTEHSSMKKHLAEEHSHRLLALACFISAAVLTVSVLKPEQLVLYISGYGLCIVKGLWYYTAGLKPPVHLVATFFALEVMLVSVSIVVITALFVAPAGSSMSTKTLSDDQDKDNLSEYNHLILE